MLVICNGMLRSGSTLQYNLVRSMLEQTGLGTGRGHFEPPVIDARQLAQWTEVDFTSVIKMHGIDQRAVDLLPTKKVAIFYIYRDLRGVAASIRRKWNPSWSEILRSLDEAVANFETMNRTPGVLVQRYESVLADEVRSVTQIADHLDIRLTAAETSRIVQLCSPTAALRSSSNLSPRQRFSHSVNTFGHRLPRRLRVALHGTGLVSIGRRLGIQGAIYDSKTLLHPDHITHDPNAVDAWSDDLTLAEIETINTRYVQFLNLGEYTS